MRNRSLVLQWQKLKDAGQSSVKRAFVHATEMCRQRKWDQSNAMIIDNFPQVPKTVVTKERVRS